MHPDVARQALRIHPSAALTVELVEEAFAGETAVRHPWLYLDADQRHGAEEWAAHLAAARTTLLAEVAVRAAAGADQSRSRRRLSRGAIIGIVGGAVALVLAFVAGGWAVGTVVTNAAEGIQEFVESAPEFVEPGVSRWSSNEMSFTFPAAFEQYTDGRHDDLCPTDLVEGCWEEAVIPVMECAALHVRVGYFTDWEEVYPEEQETFEFEDVAAADVVPVVYGHDDYDVGYITDVVCVDY